MIGLYHGALIHPGKKKLYDYMLQYYHCPDKTYLKQQINLLCNQCLICFRCKKLIHNYKYGSSDRNLLYRPNQMILCDLYEGFKLAANRVQGDKQGVKAVLIIYDLYSHMLFIHPLNSKTQQNVIQRLTAHFSVMGPPRYLLTDNASLFRGSSIKQYCKDTNVSLLASSAMSSYSRGKIERNIQLFLHAVKKYTYNLDSIYFCKAIAEIGFSLNTMPLRKSYLTPINIHYLSSYNFLHPLQDDDKTYWNYIDVSEHTKQEFREKGVLLQKDIQKYREEFIKERLKQLDEQNANKKDHDIQLWDFVMIKNFTKEDKTEPDYNINMFQVIKVRKFAITVKCVLTGVEHTYRVSNMKKLEVENLSEVDLPLSMIDDLKILTPDNYIQLLKTPINAPIQPRTTRRMAERQREELRMENTDILNKTTYDEDDEIDDYIIDLYDQATLLHTIFE
jgi:hypothetical protein